MPQTAEVVVPLPTAEGLPARLVRDDGRPRPGVIVVHDASGPIPFYEELTTRIASAGYVALLPDLYFREGPVAESTPEAEMARLAQLNKRQSIQDLLSAAVWLTAQPGVEGARVGAVGFSLGATLALDMTAEASDLAIASFYAFPAGQVPADENSPPPPLSLAAEMSGPIIAFWGDHDEVVTMDDVRRLVEEWEAHHVPVTYTIYDGVGHSFVRLSELKPGRETSAAALDSWAKTLSFFNEKLSLHQR